MGGLFGGSTPDPPPVPPPPPTPEVGPEAAEGAERAARKRSGFRKTILTGALTPTPTGKKSLLG